MHTQRFRIDVLHAVGVLQPVVAAINGPAIGAGLCLALACDVRIASASAKMGVTFVGLGLHPGMGCTHTLPKIVGTQTASRLLLTGEVISGVEAERIGLVAAAARAVDADGQEQGSSADGEAAIAQAVALAAKMSRQAPVAVRATVRTLRMQVDEGFERALWREADAQAQTYATADLAEGVEAVASKSPAVFTHHEAYGEENGWSGVLSGRHI